MIRGSATSNTAWGLTPSSKLKAHLPHLNHHGRTSPREFRLDGVEAWARNVKFDFARNPTSSPRASTCPQHLACTAEQLDAIVSPQICFRPVHAAHGNREPLSLDTERTHVVTPGGHYMWAVRSGRGDCNPLRLVDHFPANSFDLRHDPFRGPEIQYAKTLSTPARRPQIRA